VQVLRSLLHSFDAVLNQLFALSLLVATGARAGDTGHTYEDSKDKALQIREVEMYLSGEADLRNVILRIAVTHYKGNRYRDGDAIRHKNSTFERPENAILDPNVLAIAVFSRRGLLSRSVEDILAKAEAHPDRRIEIGTPKDTRKPVLVHLTKSSSYNDHGLKAVSSRNISQAVNDVGQRGGVSSNIRGQTVRRETVQDANHLKDD
jgi:hypothetical protein